MAIWPAWSDRSADPRSAGQRRFYERVGIRDGSLRYNSEKDPGRRTRGRTIQDVGRPHVIRAATLASCFAGVVYFSSTAVDSSQAVVLGASERVPEPVANRLVPHKWEASQMPLQKRPNILNLKKAVSIGTREKGVPSITTTMRSSILAWTIVVAVAHD